MPECPAVTGRGTLYGSTDLMDRSSVIGGNYSTVGPDFGIPSAAVAAQHGAGFKQPTFDQPAEGDARLFPLRWRLDQA